MKKLVRSYKSVLMICCFIMMGNLTIAQNGFCEPFSQDTSVWIPQLTASQNAAVPGASGLGTDFYMHTYEDGPGYVYNDSDFRGNWNNFIDYCLCWDFRVFDHNGTNPSVNPTLSIYSGSPTSPVLMATFVGNASVAATDGWAHICAPILSCGTALPSNGEGQWQMDIGSGCADFNTLLGAVDGIRLNVDYTPSFGEQYGFDNICIEDCGPPPPGPDGAYCCEGDNLVVNGNFEAGNTGFTSSYTNSLLTFPGEYDVVTNASNFGKIITDHSFCVDPVMYPSNDMYMVANGRTCGGSSIIWEQTISGLEIGEEYTFCANFKDMEQCTFNVVPTITLRAGTSINQTINTNDGNPCDWETVSLTFTATGPTMVLQIELDENVTGDGNDIAIDDIGVFKRTSDTFITVQHQGNNNQITASVNTISPSDDAPYDLIPSGCDYYWFAYRTTSFPSGPILEVGYGNQSGHFGFAAGPQSWGSTTMFPGYPFASNSLYVIGLYVPETECCEGVFTYQVTYNQLGPNTGMSSEQQAQIIDIIENGYDGNPIGVEDKILELNKLTIYPNPSKDNLTLSLLDESIESVEIKSMTGRSVLAKEFVNKSSEETIDVSTFSSGVYFVNVIGANQKRYTAKLIKE